MILSMIRGNTREFTISVMTAEGDPFSLADCDLWFSVRTEPDTPTYVFQKTTGDGITITDEAGGVGILRLAHEDTLDLPLSEQILAFDLQLVTPDTPPGVFTIQHGVFIVQPNITAEIA